MFYALFQFDYCYTVLALTEKSRTKTFYRRVRFKMLLYSCTKNSRSLSVDNGDDACARKNCIVDEHIKLVNALIDRTATDIKFKRRLSLQLTLNACFGNSLVLNSDLWFVFDKS